MHNKSKMEKMNCFPHETRLIGEIGEDYAAAAYRKAGFLVLVRNYMTCYGEIDIVAYKDCEIHFVEVKARNSDSFGYPSEAVTNRKQQRIRRAAEQFMLENYEFEFDEIVFDVFELEGHIIEGCF